MGLTYYYNIYTHMLKRATVEFLQRKGTTRSESSRTLINSTSSSVIEEEAMQIQHQNGNDNEGSEGNGFFACYLLTSLNPSHKRSTYIGFTVNPRRRIRQHNGEIGAGAFRTKKKRPWEMVMCIYGFPTNVSALQFEWAWQHPTKSLAVRKAAAGFKSLSGLANSIKLAHTMLTLPSWQSMNITVNFFSTKYMNHCAGCPTLPGHMKVKIGSMDELPCYTQGADGFSENEDYSLDEAEFDNNTSNGDSVQDICDDSIAHDSPKSRNQEDKVSESFGWNQEPEPREPPGHSFASEDPSQSFDSITSPMVRLLAAVTSLKRVETIEYTDFMRVPVKSGIELSQPECERSGAISAANKNLEVRSTLIVPYETEIIDLCTPSPSCRNAVSKKRKVSSFLGADFIDLTRSPNFVQL